MNVRVKKVSLVAGTILAATAASLCCILPLAVVLLGVGSATAAARFEPFRPFLSILTLTFLGIAFYRAYRPRKACAAGESCSLPANRRQKIGLWILAAIALALLAFPYYVNWIL